jgi:inosine-uridine nucleoside N-ribohydrolase
VKAVTVRSIFYVLASAILLNVSLAATPRRVIIDTDPGSDDAIAIILALNSPEIEVDALTVVPGNVTAEQGLQNALKIVSLANRCDVAVAAGAQHPLNQKLITAEFWHGKNGLANIELPASKCKQDVRFGPDLIIEMVHKYPHEVTLVPIGPLTNIALAVSKDPSIVPLVKEVVIMGGSINGGNVNAAAEANIYNDPEAAAIVFNAGFASLTMVGSDIGERTLFTKKQLQVLESAPGPQADFIAGIARFLLGMAEKYGDIGTAMYDPLAVGTAIDPTVVTTKEMKVEVETQGQFTRGETVANRHGAVERDVLQGDHYTIEALDSVKPNAKVAVDSNADKFLNMLVSRIKGK